MLRRCLDKDLKRRLQAIGEARIAIEATQGGAASGEPGPRPAPTSPPRHSWLPRMAAATATVAAVIAVLLFQNRQRPAERMQIIPVQAVATGNMTPFVATAKASETNGQISPDGKWVAYASDESSDWEVYVTTIGLDEKAVDAKSG